MLLAVKIKDNFSEIEGLNLNENELNETKELMKQSLIAFKNVREGSKYNEKLETLLACRKHKSLPGLMN